MSAPAKWLWQPAVPAGVDPGPAADLQQIAWDHVRDYYTAPSSGQHSMEECRAFVADNVCTSYWTLKGDVGQIGGRASRYIVEGEATRHHTADAAAGPHCPARSARRTA